MMFASDTSSDEEEDVCPPECDAATYEKVLELREKRLDQEDILVEFNRGVDELKTLNERQQMKEKNIDKELRNTEKAIQEFQTEKQHSLNKIHDIVPLRLSQIECLDEEDRIPQDISPTLVFTHRLLEGLRNRITELQAEKITLRKEYHDLKREHKSLTRELK